jgi:diacylglycerol kinase family enzyme
MFSQPETTSIQARTAVRPPAEARVVLVSANPRAGSRSRLNVVNAIVEALGRSGFFVRKTSDLRELQALAAEGVASGELRAVIAVGGDGTALVVRNHTPLELPLLVVPKGTENLLGRFVRQKTDAGSVCDVLERGVVVELDLGRAGDKYFLLMISAGFDAEVIRHLHENRRGNITHASYVLPTLKAVRCYGYPPMRIYWNAPPANSAAHECRWMFGFNLPLYALGLPIAPDANGTDGLLDVCTFERGAVWSVARYLWHVTRRMHLMLPDAVMHRSPGFRLEAVDGATIPYQLDGDYAGTLPVDVSLLPGQLRMLVSTETAAALGFRPPRGV